MTSKREKILLQGLADGNEKAFREVFEHYYPKVKCFLRQFIHNEEDARDLAQNIFIKIWLQRVLLREIKSFGAYLYTMCRNAAIDYGRVYKVKIPFTEGNEGEYESESEFFAKETEIQVTNIIKGLPEKRKKIFIMSRLEGKSYEEIAQKMGITRKTVENHIHLALKELRKIISVMVLFI